MHSIQQHILNQLIRHSNCRYSDLKPSDIEGNLFMYHLRALMKQGWVAKMANGEYHLTTSGQQYSDTLSLVTLTPRAQPRIVTLLMVQNQEQDFLFLKRKRQPLMGQIGFPYGKIHLGESVSAAAKRELSEKAGLMAQLTHRGDGYITICADGEPVSHIMFHLFYGINPTGSLVPESPAGSVFWAPEWKISSQYMPSCLDLIAELRKTPPTQRFFIERTYNTHPEPA